MLDLVLWVHCFITVRLGRRKEKPRHLDERGGARIEREKERPERYNTER